MDELAGEELRKEYFKGLSTGDRLFHYNHPYMSPSDEFMRERIEQRKTPAKSGMTMAASFADLAALVHGIEKEYEADCSWVVHPSSEARVERMRVLHVSYSAIGLEYRRRCKLYESGVKRALEAK